jgi:acetolactate synthase I/III small subunit
LTIVVGTEAVQLEQVVKQLNKLVHVLKIVELDPASSVERETAARQGDRGCRRAQPDHRARDVFRAKIVDVDHDSLTIEAAGAPRSSRRWSRCSSRSGSARWSARGTISLARGARSITDGSKLRMQRVV